MRNHTSGCCDGEGAAPSVAERRLLGERRRTMVRRAVLTAAVTLCLVGLVALAFGHSPALAGRALWASALCGVGPVGGWVRQAMATHRPGWRLVLAAVVVAGGVVWQPVMPALAAIATLTEQLSRPAATPTGR